MEYQRALDPNEPSAVHRLPRQPRALGPLLAAFAVGTAMHAYADDADAQRRHGRHHHQREAASAQLADASDLGPDRGREGGVVEWTDEDEVRLRTICSVAGEGRQAREISASSLALCHDLARRNVEHHLQTGEPNVLAEADFVSRMRQAPGRTTTTGNEFNGLAEQASADEVRALAARLGARAVRVDYRLTRYAQLTDTQRRRGPALDLALMDRQPGVAVEEQQFLQETLEREPNAHVDAEAQERMAEAIAHTPAEAFLSATYLLSARLATEAGGRQRGSFDIRSGGTALSYAQEASSQLVYGLRLDACAQDTEGAWHVRVGGRPAIRGRE